MATQSLYRRYRPRRFSELKGQDHVVRALRDAVASGREGQAYLFSGPRGTGKTTSARILAKVLNCENVVGGEPCCECESCLSVERGTSYDVHELDAASNNGVDAIRDLVEKASLGTPGRHKVYILDEVHMLSKAAEAALLKTLEEPPPHVVFVLATTDPQKMSDTIRSRTQHLQFHLLPSDTMAEHAKWVAEDAGLDLSEAALEAALIQGGGSARDTLSALELLASTGGDVSDVIDMDEFLVALTDRDPGRVLTAMGHAVNLGRDPRTVTEDIVRHLRNAFLSLIAPELVVLPRERLDAIAVLAQQLGAAGLVRAIERLGSALVDMRHAPDPRILVEVALVQLTHDESGSDIDALMVRLERLEQSVKQLRSAAPSAAPSSAGSASAPRDPTTGRAVLGGGARRPTPAPAPATDATTDATTEAATDQGTSSNTTVGDTSGDTSSDTVAPSGDAHQGAPAAQPVRPEPTPAPAGVPAISVPDAWEKTVKSQVKPLVRALYSAGSFLGSSGDTWQFGVPNDAHGGKCNEHRAAVEAALSQAVGTKITIEFVVASRSPHDADHSTTPVHDTRSAPPATPATPATSAPRPTPAPTPTPTPADQPRSQPVPAPDRDHDHDHDRDPGDDPEPDRHVPQHDDEIDLNDLTDVPPESVKTPIDRLAEAFPGSELIVDD